MANAALDALTAAGITHRVVQHEHVTSLAEAAVQAGARHRRRDQDHRRTPRADDNFVLVLVPGDRARGSLLAQASGGAGRQSTVDARGRRDGQDATEYEPGRRSRRSGQRPNGRWSRTDASPGEPSGSAPARATPPSYSPRTMPYGSWTPPSPTSPIRRRPDARPPAQSGSSRPQVHGDRGSAGRRHRQDGLRCHPSRRSPPPEPISPGSGCAERERERRVGRWLEPGEIARASLRRRPASPAGRPPGRCATRCPAVHSADASTPRRLAARGIRIPRQATQPPCDFRIDRPA